MSGLRKLLQTTMSSPATSAPFTRAVVNSIRKLYPEALADKSFDNTGLLLEAPFNPHQRQKNSVLLTIDLTKAVADEAIARRDSIIVAYHPIIFRGLKSFTLKDTQQQSLLRLAAAGISVYCPHTAIDGAKGGLGDWLADLVTGTFADADTDVSTSPNPNTSSGATPNSRPTYTLQHHPSQHGQSSAPPPSPSPRSLRLGTAAHERYPIVRTSVPGHPDAGMGRVVRLAEPVPLPTLVDRLAAGLGHPVGFPLAIPQNRRADEILVRSAAVCAGSGGHLFGELAKAGDEVDLLFTGELSHHEALAAIEQGKCVISLFHSNSERGFLHGVLKGQLEREVEVEWKELREEESAGQGRNDALREALSDESVEIYVSEVDRDPYGIMINKSEL